MLKYLMAFSITLGSIAMPLFADEVLVHEISHEAVVLQDQQISSRFLVIDPSKAEASVISEDDQEPSTYRVLDEDCMDEALLLNGRFLVGLKWSCEIDDDEGEIRLMDRVSASDGALAIVYVGRLGDLDYYVINSREFPNAAAGEISLKVVDRTEPSSELLAFIGGVPGFSGGMALDRSSATFYYTESTGAFSNTIYRLPAEDLLGLIESGGEHDFRDVFGDGHGPLTDLKLSFALFADDSMLVYDNRSPWGDYDSYLLNENLDITIISFDENCKTIGAHAGRLYQYCEGRGIVSQDFSNLR